jgi:hypothetical protein
VTPRAGRRRLDLAGPAQGIDIREILLAAGRRRGILSWGDKITYCRTRMAI